jgi:plasmid stabilization system protein ParE
MRVSFLEAADAEVDAALAWYAERSLLAASGFLHELSKTINHIVDAPHRYPKAEHSTRKIRFDRFPYSIYYRIRTTPSSSLPWHTASGGLDTGLADHPQANQWLRPTPSSASAP